jgi:peptidoglycan L-alanyl-D-glutamate endopeptidase CwlK
MTWTVTSRDNLLNDPRVHHVARQKFRAVLADVRGKGLPLLVWEVFRSREQQRALYAQGRTDAELRRVGYSDEEIVQYRKQGYLSTKPIVTKLLNPKYHGTGRAMDCCWLVDGAPTWNVSADWWETYGRAAETHGLTWGGRWRMRDLSHVQYEGE